MKIPPRTVDCPTLRFSSPLVQLQTSASYPKFHRKGDGALIEADAFLERNPSTMPITGNSSDAQ